MMTFINRTLLTLVLVASCVPAAYWYFLPYGIDLFWLALLHGGLALLLAVSLRLSATGFDTESSPVSWVECSIGLSAAAILAANIFYLLLAYATSDHNVSDISRTLGGEDRRIRHILGVVLGMIWLLASVSAGMILGQQEFRTRRPLLLQI